MFVNVKRWTVGVAGVLLTSGAGQAYAQSCNTTGPDVIVGDITGPSNYTSAGGYEAFSIGTYSCNIGNVWLNWIDSTNQHPVISQNLFKLNTVNGSTRFEQIGQSWLKHGFFALSDTLCCTGCVPTDGTHLGVHCADPYTSGRNGSQGGLGPKWQVNAATGAFTYPPANPAWSGSTARRLQVPITSLEASSTTVRYFAEAMYVSPDDATANNKYNNASYRQATMSGSGSAWTMAFTGTTVRTRQGLRAWAAFDTGVVEKDMFVTNDGLFLLSAKVTDLGGGTWHYEYAVYNMNSDRSGQAFSIPIPPCVTVSNIGFHDVEYLNGDGPGSVNYSGTDWTASVAGGAITWSTQTFAQNQSANALRWGTLYNFRFDANRGPVAGGATATVTLFKPGTPSSVTASGIPAPSGGTSSPADIDGDCEVGLGDLTIMLSAYGTCVGDPGFNPAADLNGDGCIDLADLTTLLSAFGL